ARTRISAMNPPGFSWAQADFQAYLPTRNSLVTCCYGKEDHACQPEDLRNRYYRGGRRRVVWPENNGKCTLSAYSYKYPTGLPSLRNGRMSVRVMILPTRLAVSSRCVGVHLRRFSMPFSKPSRRIWVFSPSPTRLIVSLPAVTVSPVASSKFSPALLVHSAEAR